MYCTSWGRAAGDFHFVMEHAHARVLMGVHYPTSKPLLFNGHGWIKAVITNALGVLPTPPAARCSQSKRRLEGINDKWNGNRSIEGGRESGRGEGDRAISTFVGASAARMLASSDKIVDSEWCPPLQVPPYGHGAVVNDLQVHGGMVRSYACGCGCRMMPAALVLQSAVHRLHFLSPCMIRLLSMRTYLNSQLFSLPVLSTFLGSCSRNLGRRSIPKGAMTLLNEYEGVQKCNDRFPHCSDFPFFSCSTKLKSSWSAYLFSCPPTSRWILLKCFATVYCFGKRSTDGHAF